jgi:hypothetical protein
MESAHYNQYCIGKSQKVFRRILEGHTKILYALQILHSAAPEPTLPVIGCFLGSKMRRLVLQVFVGRVGL